MRCSAKRRGRTLARSAGCGSASATRMAMPAALRSARISNSASDRANARTATAVAENDDESAGHPEDDGEDIALCHETPGGDAATRLAGRARRGKGAHR